MLVFQLALVVLPGLINYPASLNAFLVSINADRTSSHFSNRSGDKLSMHISCVTSNEAISIFLVKSLFIMYRLRAA